MIKRDLFHISTKTGQLGGLNPTEMERSQLKYSASRAETHLAAAYINRFLRSIYLTAWPRFFVEIPHSKYDLFEKLEFAPAYAKNERRHESLIHS